MKKLVMMGVLGFVLYFLWKRFGGAKDTAIALDITQVKPNSTAKAEVVNFSVPFVGPNHPGYYAPEIA